MDERISVVIPVYNVEQYLEECITSVLSQTYKNIELILVNDGSTDRSAQIINDFAQKDSRIIARHKENEGVSAARNDGLSLATGEYIYVMDSDDYIEPDTLEIMAKSMKSTGADVVIADHYTFTENGVQEPHHFFSFEFVTADRGFIDEIQRMVLHPGYSPLKTTENTGLGIAAPWTKLVRGSLIRENTLRFDSYVEGIFDDGLFSLEVFQVAKKVAYVRDLTCHYRILKSSLIHRFNPKRRVIDKKVFEKIREFELRNDKGPGFHEAYYARVIIYLVHSFEIYYFNNTNEKSMAENYREFISMITESVYAEAIKKCDVKRLKRVQAGVTMLARMHLYPCIWIPFQARKRIRSKRR